MIRFDCEYLIKAKYEGCVIPSIGVSQTRYYPKSEHDTKNSSLLSNYLKHNGVGLDLDILPNQKYGL